MDCFIKRLLLLGMAIILCGYTSSIHCFITHSILVFSNVIPRSKVLLGQSILKPLILPTLLTSVVSERCFYHSEVTEVPYLSKFLEILNVANISGFLRKRYKVEEVTDITNLQCFQNELF